MARVSAGWRVQADAVRASAVRSKSSGAGSRLLQPPDSPSLSIYLGAAFSCSLLLLSLCAFLFSVARKMRKNAWLRLRRSD